MVSYHSMADSTLQPRERHAENLARLQTDRLNRGFEASKPRSPLPTEAVEYALLPFMQRACRDSDNIVSSLLVIGVTVRGRYRLQALPSKAAHRARQHTHKCLREWCPVLGISSVEGVVLL